MKKRLFDPFENVNTPIPHEVCVAHERAGFLTPAEFEGYVARFANPDFAALDPDSDIIGDTLAWKLYCFTQLQAEAGEFGGHLAKAVRDDKLDIDDMTSLTPDRRLKLAKELGDNLYFVVACARILGFSLENIMALNVDKLLGREQRGTSGGEGDDR